MRISRLHIDNYRCVASPGFDIDFNSDGLVTLLLGDNGCGKSSALEAIATLMGQRRLSRSDVHADRDGHRIGAARISLVADDGTMLERTYDWLKQKSGSRGRRQNLFSRPDSNGMFPIFAYFGSKIPRHTFVPRSPRIIEVLNRALAMLAGKRFRFPDDVEDNSLLVEEPGGICMDRRIPFFSLGAGYRRLFSIAAGIVRLMVRANPQADNLLLTPGVLLIDELDLHLHPCWQRDIAGRLAEAFPRLQIIATTHSAVTVARAADFAKVIRLGSAGRWEDSVKVSGTLSRTDIGRLLLSDLFGLSSLLPPSAARLEKRRDEILAMPEPGPDERRELGEIDRALDGLPAGTSLRERELHGLLCAIAEKIGINPSDNFSCPR